jgi:2-polyprenyl-6-methoxyphenol hydroxylase-like FAD-dependent oxidoreductase
MNNKSLKVYQHSGGLIYDQAVVKSDTFNGRRADIHAVLYNYAVNLGVIFHMGKKVIKYGQDTSTTTCRAWVRCEDGEEFSGNVVVAADGVRSTARELVLGVSSTLKSSGYAIYRAWFSAEEADFASDNLTKEFVNGDTHTAWLGEDIHLLVATCKGGREISWVCTHKVSLFVMGCCTIADITQITTDDDNIDGSLSRVVQVDEVLKILEGWDPRCRRIVRDVYLPR